MDTYIINGVEVEYDTFDVDQMETFGAETKRLDAALKERAELKSWDDMVAFARESSEAVLDFFDAVIGEGSADKIFGGKTNVKEITEAYAEFVRQVMENTGNIGGPKLNRAQRRATKRHA